MALVALPVTMVTEHPLQALAGMDARAWLLVLLIALTLFCVNLVVQFGLARTAANRAIVIMLSELVFAAASSYFLAFEHIGWRDWLGGAMLVIAALYSGGWKPQRTADWASNCARSMRGCAFQPFLMCSAATVVKMPPRT
ncbi:MAG TPA: EamA family transporter [Burkholderiales bacterium]